MDRSWNHPDGRIIYGLAWGTLVVLFVGLFPLPAVASKPRIARINSLAPRIELVQFQSEVLGNSKHFVVTLPQEFNRGRKKTPFLLLLHGRGRNHRTIVDDPALRKAFLDAPFVTIFPEGDKAWYIDSPAAPESKYASYLEEILELAEDRYGLSKHATDRALAGWSMGGYGCVRFAQTHPGRFTAVTSIIGLLDYPRSPKAFPSGQSYPVRTKYFGDDSRVWKSFNPIEAADRLAGVSLSLITADRAFDRTMNERFSRKLHERGIPHELKMLRGRHSLSVVREAVPLVIAHTQAAFERARRRIPVYLNWDYNCLTLGPADIAALVVDARDAGVNGINLRISNKGALNRRTRAGTCYHERLDAFGKDYDPLALLIAECHRQGIAAHVWVDLFEAAYDPLITAHPEFSPQGRPGKPHLSGAPCYSQPEVRKHMLDLVDETIAYRPDAVFFCTKSSHVPKNHLRQPHNRDSGFNPPVVRRYRELHGVDIRKQPPDRKKMGKIRGEFLVDFLVEAKKRLNHADIPVIVGATVSGRLQPMGRNMLLDWRCILERKAADALLMANSRGEYHAFYSDKGRKTFAKIRQACDKVGVQFWPYIISSGTHQPIAKKVGFAGLLEYVPRQIDYLAELGGDAVLIHDLDLYTRDRNLRRALWKAAGRRQAVPRGARRPGKAVAPSPSAIAGEQQSNIPCGDFETNPEGFWFLESAWRLVPSSPLRNVSFEQHASNSRPIGWLPDRGGNPGLMTVYDWKVMHAHPDSGRTFLGRASLMLGAKPGAAKGARTVSWTAKIPVPRDLRGKQRVRVQVHGESLKGIEQVGMEVEPLDDENHVLSKLRSQAPNQGAFAWRPIEVIWPADPRADHLRIRLFLTVADRPETKGRVWFDNLTVEPVEPRPSGALTFPVSDSSNPASAGRRSARWEAEPDRDLTSVPFLIRKGTRKGTLCISLRATSPMDVVVEQRQAAAEGKGSGSAAKPRNTKTFHAETQWRTFDMPVAPGPSRLVFHCPKPGILWVDGLSLVEKEK